MNSKNKIFGFLFLFVFSCLYSQQDKMTAMDVLDKAAEAYNKQAYVSYNSKYTLYLDYTTKEVHEQYNGMVLKKDNVNYFKINNTEFISFKNYGVKINHDERALSIEKDLNAMEESPLSLATYLKGFESKLKSNGEFFICELKPAKISQVMFSKVIIYIKKSDYSIGKQELYFVEKMESKDAKGKIISTVPRLEIVFNPRTKNQKNDDFLIGRENYFTVNNNKVVVSKRFLAYKLYN